MFSRQSISCTWVIVTAMVLHGCNSGSSARSQDVAQPGASQSPANAQLPSPGAYPNLPPPPAPMPTPANAASAAGTSSRDVTSPAEAAVEVGCSYDGSQIVGPPGTRKLLNCPAGCAGHGWIWGTDHYTTDSAVCNAAVHAGLVPAEGGDVLFIREDGRPAYRGSRRNGVESSDYGAYGSGYRLQRP